MSPPEGSAPLLRLPAAPARAPGPDARPAPAPAEPPLLEARGLAFAAGGVPLIDGLDLALAPGRLTAIMGPNGAGKSLLLRLLHGLARPTGGAVLAHGRPLDRAARGRQAMVFQRPVLLRRTVAANVEFVLAARLGRWRRHAERRDALLDRVGLRHLARRPARLLSGGEQQRLALARALACAPEILFLDEPTASLDPRATQAVERIVADAQAAGARVVLVTHDPGQARRLADEVVFLHRGRVVEQGPAGRLLAAPRSAPARAYLAGRLCL
jgi:tungstate transport system ATP-binding protein